MGRNEFVVERLVRSLRGMERRRVVAYVKILSVYDLAFNLLACAPSDIVLAGIVRSNVNMPEPTYL